MRRELPLAITFIVGVGFVIAYFIPHPPFDRAEVWFSDWYAIVAAFAIWLGALNLMKISFLKIIRKRKDWPYAVLIIISFLIVAIAGFVGGINFRETGTAFDWLYDNVFVSLSATMYALLAFFVASASYRAFRARNVEATLLLLAAFFVMLGRVPIGDIITGWMPEAIRMSQVANWIMNVLNTAGQRAVMIGIALGLVSSALRVILGLERAYLAGD